MSPILKYILGLLVFSAAFFFRFMELPSNSDGDSEDIKSLQTGSVWSTEFNRQWQQSINTGSHDLGQCYTENAVKVHLDGTLSKGRDIITEYHRTNTPQIESIKAINNIRAVLDNTTVYEIGRFSTTDKKEFAHLILWREENGKLMRELEMMAPLESTIDFKPEVDRIRTVWMKICKAHNTEELVTNLYADRALYYNHRPMIVGQKAIIKEYGYMNDPNYELTLSPIVFEIVNRSLAFEIGQCSGSYPGNYVLVWQKDEEGEWRIFFDSNI